MDGCVVRVVLAVSDPVRAGSQRVDGLAAALLGHVRGVPRRRSSAAARRRPARHQQLRRLPAHLALRRHRRIPLLRRHQRQG